MFTQDTTMLVQIEEAKCAIQKLLCVTKLSPVRAVNGMGQRSKSQQSTSRVCTQRSLHACRSF
jgi:hypothetical protein